MILRKKDRKRDRESGGGRGGEREREREREREGGGRGGERGGEGGEGELLSKLDIANLTGDKDLDLDLCSLLFLL